MGNTAGGSFALYNNTTGAANTAFGDTALPSNTTGAWNTAAGALALYFNTTGGGNTAFGESTLLQNTTGNSNTATGESALISNTTGQQNTAIGVNALNYNSTGNNNTAVGIWMLYSNKGGHNNTAIGSGADVASGGYYNGTALGNGATLTASNSIVLGNGAINTIYAQVTTITGISNRRRKKDIKALDSELGLDFIRKLQPVSYRYNNGDKTERYGFIAQDLEQALPASLHDTIERSEPEHGLALIERQNDKDRTYRVAYGELFAPIVKSIQEQQQEIAAERQQNADLRHALADLAATFKAETAALHRSIDTLKEQVREQLSAAR
jgi:trimeric autotransporter adhesin